MCDLCLKEGLTKFMRLVVSEILKLGVFECLAKKAFSAIFYQLINKQIALYNTKVGNLIKTRGQESSYDL